MAHASRWILSGAAIVVVGLIGTLFIMARDARRKARQERLRQTQILQDEIAAHRLTHGELARAK
jgi:heme exporter protein D